MNAGDTRPEQPAAAHASEVVEPQAGEPAPRPRTPTVAQAHSTRHGDPDLVAAAIADWETAMISPWVPASHIGRRAHLAPPELAGRLQALVDAGALEWGALRTCGGIRDVRRMPDERAILDLIRALEARAGSAYGVSLLEIRALLRPKATYARLYLRLQALEASGRVWRASGGWRCT